MAKAMQTALQMPIEERKERHSALLQRIKTHDVCFGGGLPRCPELARARGRIVRWRLIADVGGTNVRFARVIDEENVVDRCSYLVSRFGSFLDALRAYAEETDGGLSGCSGAAIGAAGPVAMGRRTLQISRGSFRKPKLPTR